jgi:hypothetical protein
MDEAQEHLQWLHEVKARLEAKRGTRMGRDMTSEDLSTSEKLSWVNRQIAIKTQGPMSFEELRAQTQRSLAAPSYVHPASK